MQITPKMAKTAAWGIAFAMTGKRSPTAKEPIQLKEDARPEALPRMARGKTSPTSTHVRGAQVKE